MAAVNGIGIDLAGWPSWLVAAVHELLRQRAVGPGLLAEGADDKYVQLLAANAAIDGVAFDAATSPLVQ